MMAATLDAVVGDLSLGLIELNGDVFQPLTGDAKQGNAMVAAMPPNLITPGSLLPLRVELRVIHE